MILKVRLRKRDGWPKEDDALPIEVEPGQSLVIGRPTDTSMPKSVRVFLDSTDSRDLNTIPETLLRVQVSTGGGVTASVRSTKPEWGMAIYPAEFQNAEPARPIMCGHLRAVQLLAGDRCLAGDLIGAMPHLSPLVEVVVVSDPAQGPRTGDTAPHAERLAALRLSNALRVRWFDSAEAETYSGSSAGDSFRSSRWTNRGRALAIALAVNGLASSAEQKSVMLAGGAHAGRNNNDAYLVSRVLAEITRAEKERPRATRAYTELSLTRYLGYDPYGGVAFTPDDPTELGYSRNSDDFNSRDNFVRLRRLAVALGRCRVIPEDALRWAEVIVREHDEMMRTRK